MAEVADDTPQADRPYERVYVENEWYDGPRSGVADVDGVPHYFQSPYLMTESDDEYHVWPVTEEVLAMEQEQWRIFTAWNANYEAGTETAATHPATGGVDARYDELTAALEPLRRVPEGARMLIAEWQPGGGEGRYPEDGPRYRVQWRSSREG